MKQLFLILIFSIFSFADNHINLATVPWQSSEALQKMYNPLIKLIEGETGKKVNFLIARNYMELSKRIASKNVDIALFGANSYVEAKELLGDKIVYLGTTMHPTDHYNSLILTHKNSNIHTIQDLKNKNFAFTDVGSTSGYIYPNLMLYKEGIKNPNKFFKTITMLKKHNRIYDAIAKRSIDAGGASITVYNDAVKKNGDIYRILKKSDPIPNGPVIAGSHMGDKLIQELKDIFKNKKNKIYFKEYKSELTGISIKSDAYYNIVREAKSFKDNK